MRMDQTFFTFAISLHRLELDVAINSELTIEICLKVGKDNVCTVQDLRFGRQAREMEVEETIEMTVPMYLNQNNNKNSSRGQPYQSRWAVLEISTISLSKNIKRAIGQVRFDLGKYLQKEQKEVYECYAIEKSDYQGKLAFTLDYRQQQEEETAEVVSQDLSEQLNGSQNNSQNNPFTPCKTIDNQSTSSQQQYKSPMKKQLNKQKTKEVFTKIPMVKEPKSPNKRVTTSIYHSQLQFNSNNSNNTNNNNNNNHNSNNSNGNTNGNTNGNNGGITSSMMTKLTSKGPLLGNSQSNINLAQSQRLATTPTRKTLLPQPSHYKNLVDLQEKNKQLELEKQQLLDNMQISTIGNNDQKQLVSQLRFQLQDKEAYIQIIEQKMEGYNHIQMLNSQMLTDLGIQQVALQTIFDVYNEEFDQSKLEQLMEKLKNDLNNVKTLDTEIISLKQDQTEKDNQIIEQQKEIENLNYQNTNLKRKQRQDEEYLLSLQQQKKQTEIYNKELEDKEIALEILLQEQKEKEKKQEQKWEQEKKELEEVAAECKRFEQTYQDLYKQTKNKLGNVINLIFEDNNNKLMEKVETLVME